MSLSQEIWEQVKKQIRIKAGKKLTNEPEDESTARVSNMKERWDLTRQHSAAVVIIALRKQQNV